MSDSKIFPNRNFIFLKEQKTKKSQKFLGKYFLSLRNLLCNYSCLNLIGQSFRAFLDMCLILQIFHPFVNILEKNLTLMMHKMCEITI